MSHVLSELSDLAANELFDEPVETGLPAELIHGIEAVVTPTSPQVRSVAIAGVVDEIYRTVEWLHGGDVGQAELASLAQVLAATRDHQARMATLVAGA